MKVLSIVVVLVAIVVAAEAARPMRKSLQPSLIEKKAHKKAKILPHPSQFYRASDPEKKTTPGPACSSFTSCEDCAKAHICVWTKDKCLDQRDPASVYGTREPCNKEDSNGYKDVTSRKELEQEEKNNMIGDAELAEDELGGDRVVIHAVDKDIGELEPSPEDKEKLTNPHPEWARNAKVTHTHWKSPDGKATVHTKTTTVTKTSGGPPHDPPPATGDDGEDFDAGETGQETPEGVEESADAGDGGEEAAADETASFKSKRTEPSMDHLHEKYMTLERRVKALEAQIASEPDEEQEVPADASEEDSSDDELTNDVQPDVEYGALFAASDDDEDEDEDQDEDNYENFDDPTAVGEHEPIVKEVTVTKITKDENGQVLGEPKVTKTLEQVDEGKTDIDP